MVAASNTGVYRRSGISMEEEARYCRNGRAPITGECCSECGQREGRAEKRFHDLAGEFPGDVLDLDSRFS